VGFFAVIIVLGAEEPAEEGQAPKPVILGFINPGTGRLFPFLTRFGFPAVTPAQVGPALPGRAEIRAEGEPIPFVTPPIDLKGPGQVLVNLVPQAAARSEARNAVIDALLGVLQDRNLDGNIRLEAARALGEFGPAESLPALVTLNSVARAQANEEASILRDTARHSLIQAIHRGLQDTRPALRLEFLTITASLDSYGITLDELVPDLISALGDSEPAI
jgi:hypothetical protein